MRGKNDISLIGFMGCGKSSVGKELAALLPECRLIDLDTYIERKQGMSIPEIFNEYGEAAFRRMELEALKEIFSDNCRPQAILSLGGGTVTSEECRQLIRRNTDCFYLRATIDTLLGNLEGHSAGRPMLAPASVPVAVVRQAHQPVEAPGNNIQLVASTSSATEREGCSATEREGSEPGRKGSATEREGSEPGRKGSATEGGICTEREALRQRIEALMRTRSAQYLETAHHIIDIDGQTFAQTAASINALL